MTEVDAYLERLDEGQRGALLRIREIVQEALPSAVEVMSYGMPGFKYRGAYLVGYCAHTKHLSLYPTAGPIEAHKTELEGFPLSRGTIRFTLEHQIPKPLIEKLLTTRAEAIAQHPE